jgi:lipopolysaccharide/colanic/teichoic acid biosynthesis glycosyltransferase
LFWKPGPADGFVRPQTAQALDRAKVARGETETLEKMERRVEFDHRYIREWSLWMDLKILVKTVLVVFKQENAY